MCGLRGCGLGRGCGFRGRVWSEGFVVWGCGSGVCVCGLREVWVWGVCVWSEGYYLKRNVLQRLHC